MQDNSIFDDAELVAEFQEEAVSLLADAEGLLFNPACNPEDLRRIFHTIKGLSGSFGLTDLETVSRRVEALFDRSMEQSAGRSPAVIVLVQAIVRSYRLAFRHSDMRLWNELGSDKTLTGALHAWEDHLDATGTNAQKEVS